MNAASTAVSQALGLLPERLSPKVLQQLHCCIVTGAPDHTWNARSSKHVGEKSRLECSTWRPTTDIKTTPQNDWSGSSAHLHQGGIRRWQRTAPGAHTPLLMRS